MVSTFFHAKINDFCTLYGIYTINDYFCTLYWYFFLFLVSTRCVNTNIYIYIYIKIRARVLTTRELKPTVPGEVQHHMINNERAKFLHYKSTRVSQPRTSTLNYSSKYFYLIYDNLSVKSCIIPSIYHKILCRYQKTFDN